MTRNRWRTLALAAVASVLGPWARDANAADVRLHGATTVIDRVIDPHRAAVERATGHKLHVVGNATGKGLADLVQGECDASLSSEPVEIAVEAAGRAGQWVDASKLVFHVVETDTIVFVVHPSNPVRSLTWEQLRDIHLGKIRNWSEVGGRDQPITVFADTPTGGTRAMVRSVVMRGQEYAKSTVSVSAVKKVAEQVAAEPRGIGALGRGFATSRVQILATKPIERPLGFLTIGPPSAPVKAVIEAFKAEAAKK